MIYINHPFGGRHLTLSWALWTVLAVSRAGASYDDSLFRFRISSKNGSGYKLNHPDWRKSPYPHPGTHHRFSHIGATVEFKISLFRFRFSSKIGLDTS